MPQKKKADDSYEKFTASVKAGQFGNFYIFHGDERYLLDHSIGELRRNLCPDGLDSFNYKKFEGSEILPDDIEDAIDTLPVFACRTLIEIHDLDIFKGKKKTESDVDDVEDSIPTINSKGSENKEKQRYTELFSDLPEYVCVVIIFDTIPYKPDVRQKYDKEILMHAQVVEFSIQTQSKLIGWIDRRFAAIGKRISRSDAEYLALITDGFMSSLVGEIEKVSAYSNNETVTREDIDAVVTPVLNAFAYKLTDAILECRYSEAMRILDELLAMREPPQKILFSISLKMRQFLAARVFDENGRGKQELMDICGIRFDFQAVTLIKTARKATLSRCRHAVLQCAEAAYDLNSSPEPEARLVELIARLAFAL